MVGGATVRWLGVSAKPGNPSETSPERRAGDNLYLPRSIEPHRVTA
jgi:hypothetical protein